MVEFERFVLAILFGSISCSYVKVWRRTKIKEKFLFGQFSSMIVKSVNKCAEECSCSSGCKSFGFNVDSFNCSLYEDFAYSGSNINQVYYWEVLGNCSVTQGYQLDATGTVCYKVYSENINWTDAQQRCEQDGGHLFISDTMNRYSIVQNSLPGNKIHVGSTDLVEEVHVD